jgi:hypothetical protein
LLFSNSKKFFQSRFSICYSTRSFNHQEYFMSLEQAIAANTAAIQELIAMWGKLNAQAVAIDKMPAAAGVNAAGKPVKAAPEKAVATAAAAVKETAKPTEAAAPAATAKPAAAADYAPVGAAITAYAAANGREATLAKLEPFGVTSGKALKPEQYAAVLAAFTAEEEVA